MMKNQPGHLRNLSNTYTHPTTYTDIIHSACIHAHHMHHITTHTHTHTNTHFTCSSHHFSEGMFCKSV